MVISSNYIYKDNNSCNTNVHNRKVKGNWPCTHFISPSTKAASSSVASTVSTTEAPTTSEATTSSVAAITASSSTVCEQRDKNVVNKTWHWKSNKVLHGDNQGTDKLLGPHLLLRLLVSECHTCYTLAAVQNSCCHKSCEQESEKHFINKNSALQRTSDEFNTSQRR